MKRFASCLALCALTLSSGAQAAMQVVNTAAYQLSYDDTVLSYLGNGELSFKSFSGVSTSGFLGDGGDASGAPYLTLTATPQHLITGVSQTVTGSFSGGDVSGLLLAYTSWSEPAVSFTSAIETGDEALPGGSFVLSKALDLTGASGKSLSLMGFRLGAGLMVNGEASSGVGSLDIQSFKLNVQTLGDVSPVPEPQLLALVAAGFGVVMLRRRSERI